MTKSNDAFDDDIAYLEAEFRWLSKRCRRMAALRAAQSGSQESPNWDGPHDDELVARALKLAARFEREAHELRATVDSRLSMTREQRGATALGLDAICSKHDLDADARLVVLALTVPGISQAFAEAMFEEVSPSAYYFVTVDMAHDLIVGEPVGLRDALRLRRMWDVDSPLLQSSIVEMTLSAAKSRAPVDLLDATLRLSEYAFRLVTGGAEA